MSEFQTGLNADDIKALAQLLVYRTPNRLRVIAAVKFLTRLIYAEQKDMYLAKNPDACVMDTTLLLLRAMNTAVDPPTPKFWQVKRLVRWALLKGLRVV
jgi:hypothetical protein